MFIVGKSFFWVGWNILLCGNAQSLSSMICNDSLCRLCWVEVMPLVLAAEGQERLNWDFIINQKIWRHRNSFVNISWGMYPLYSILIWWSNKWYFSRTLHSQSQGEVSWLRRYIFQSTTGIWLLMYKIEQDFLWDFKISCMSYLQ